MISVNIDVNDWHEKDERILQSGIVFLQFFRYNKTNMTFLWGG